MILCLKQKEVLTMDYRKLGRTGLKVSVISFGGVMAKRMQQEEVKKAVSEAINRGVNLFDVGPTYGDSQNKLGPAIENYRQQIILTCKTEPDNTKEEARKDLENSLRLLKTDYFDVYQLHEVTDKDSLKKSLDSGGALEAILEAKEKGLVRYIGFSAHSEEYALKLMELFDFDTVMFPTNWNYWLNYNQGEAVIKRARETNKGILAIKALAQRQWKENEAKDGYATWYRPLFDNDELAKLALKFTLSKDIDTAVSPGDQRLLKKCLDLVEDYQGAYNFSKSEEEMLEYFLKTHGGKLYPMPPKV
jgi:predicted aldo/keto reductase-like oxidoreductase